MPDFDTPQNPSEVTSSLGGPYYDADFSLGNKDANPLDYDSAEDYYKAYTGNMYNSNSLWGRIGNWFSGNVSATKERYENAWNKKNQEDAIALQAATDRALRQSEYSDAVESMKAAGLNPYSLMTGNGFGTTAASSSTSAVKYQSHEVGSNKVNAKGLLALIWLAAKIIASL